MELRKRLHEPIAKTAAWVYSVLKGHLNYFAVSGHDPQQPLVLAAAGYNFASSCAGPQDFCAPSS
jgi:hypothetical protein